MNTEELHFSHPVDIIGQGAFGVVLSAEYRGTKVAIKRVLPTKEKRRISKSGSVDALSKENLDEEVEKDDIEDGSRDSIGRRSITVSGDSKTSTNQLDFLGRMSFGREESRFRRWLPFLYKENSTSRVNSMILGTVSGSSHSTRGLLSTIFPWCDETARRQEEFKEEMRLLSRLRHPCKY